MFLSKRGKIYYLFYFDEANRRHKVSTRCRRKADALRFLQQFRQQKSLKPKLLSDFVEEYLAYSSTLHRLKTQESFRTSFRQFLHVIGDTPLNKVGIREVEKFIITKTQQASVQTARVYFVTLASAFQTAKRWQYIQTNPFRETPSPKLPEYHPRSLTKDEFCQLLKTVNNLVLRDLFICAVCTGMRLSELTALCWKDVNFETRIIHIQNSESFKTKTGKNRAIPMNESLRIALLHKVQRVSSNLVFHLCGRKLRKEYVSKGFKRYIRLAGLEERLTFHSLRHTFASWLASDGVGLYEIQKLLGHSSASMTQRYAHLQPDQLHTTVNRIRLPITG